MVGARRPLVLNDALPALLECFDITQEQKRKHIDELVRDEWADYDDSERTAPALKRLVRLMRDRVESEEREQQERQRRIEAEERKAGTLCTAT